MSDPRCPTCLHPRATDADAATIRAYLDKVPRDPSLPAGWPDPEGSHLCWSGMGYCGFAPEWWDTVTPLVVEQLRADLSEAQRQIAHLQEQVTFERRHNDYLTDMFVLKDRVRPRRPARERCVALLFELLAGPGRG